MSDTIMAESSMKPQKDVQTVTSEGKSVQPLIDGVSVRPAMTIPDERGTICEIFNPAWGFHSEEPLAYVYQVTVRPGKVKGWVIHYEQDDRLFISQGTLKVVLYDDRDSSPTRGLLNELYLSEQNRGLIHIPRGVYHALQNVGNTDALFINMPTSAFKHAGPDKYRLPVDTDAIPYSFEEKLGR